MGTNCAPLLADLFLYLYEAEFIKKKHKKHLLWSLTRHLDVLMMFYPFTTVTFTLIETQYIPVSLK